jgi:hypothetical protein
MNLLLAHHIERIFSVNAIAHGYGGVDGGVIPQLVPSSIPLCCLAPVTEILSHEGCRRDIEGFPFAQQCTPGRHVVVLGRVFADQW